MVAPLAESGCLATPRPLYYPFPPAATSAEAGGYTRPPGGYSKFLAGSDRETSTLIPCTFKLICFFRQHMDKCFHRVITVCFPSLSDIPAVSSC
ncbi:hypothetical protein E2C01_009415 [Portunus trituberculatus]|uniref:Uncharacterized protein n=1 Tax=Portunus trituberculatus TaxID=210409 RepID=A0A5B7D5J3_PORTR|nr:hypothetical protein [Portunus trituberculatus]